MDIVRERSVRFGAGALAALGVAALLLLNAGGANAVPTHTLTVVPPGTPGDVALTGKTFEQVARALSRDSTPTIPLSIPGLQTISDVPVTLQPDDTVNHVITLVTEAPQDLFGDASPLDGLPLDLLLVADWDDAKVDTLPDVVLALRAPDNVALEELFPLWGELGLPPLPGELADVVELTDAVLPLVGTDVTLDPSQLPTVVTDFIGLEEERVLDDVSSLLADLDLSGLPSAVETLQLLLAETGDVGELTGSLADSAAWLFGEAPNADDFDLDAPISIDSADFPDWLQDRLPSFRLDLGPGPDHTPSFLVHDSFDVVTGGVTNTFDYDVGLEDARDLDISVETAAFDVPFGLDWMGPLTNVALNLSYDGGSEQLDATFDADLPIASPAPRAHIEVADSPTATKAVVDVEGDVSGNDIATWLVESPAFATGGVDPGALGDLVLHSFELGYDDSLAGEHVSLFADATLPVPDFVTSPETLDVTALVAASDPDGDGPTEATLLAALRAVDPGCDLDPGVADVQPCIHVAALLPFPDLSVAGDLVMPAINLLTVQPKGASFATTGLGDDGTAFLTEALGTPPADPFVIDADVRFTADIPESVLGPVMSAVGLEPSGPLHLTGDFAFTLEDLSLGDVESVDLTASLDGLDFGQPTGVPDWFADAFDWPSAGSESWALSAHFDDGADPDAHADDTVSLALGIEGITTTLIPGPTFSASAVITGNLDQCDFDVTLTGAMGEWPAPFGIEWLDIHGASVVVALTIDDCALVDTEVTVQGVFTVGEEPSGVDLAVTVAIDALDPDPSLTVSIALLNTITVEQVLSGVFPDLDLSAMPAEVLETGFGPGSLTAVLTADDLRVSVVLDTTFSLGGDPIDVSALALADFSLEPFELTSFAFGVQPQPGLMLSDLLPGVELPEIRMSDSEPPVPLDFQLTGPDAAFAFMFTDGGLNVNSLGLPDEATCTADPDAIDCDLRGWIAPLFGGSPAGGSVDDGFRVLGALGLPEPLDEFVEMIGVQPDVLLSGGLSFDPLALDVALSLRLDPDILPSFVYGDIPPELSIRLSLDADLRLSLALEGELILKLQQGLDPTAADAMALLGLDQIPRADGSTTPIDDTACDAEGIADSEDVDLDGNPFTPETEERWFCYDLLAVELGVEIGVAALPTPRIEATLFGGISVVDANGEAAPGAEWHPMGLPFITVQDLFAQIVLRFEPASATPINVNIGVRGLFSVGTTQFDGAVQVGLGIVPGSPPVVTPTFEGVRMGISAISLEQLLNLQSQIASMSSSMPDLETVAADILDAVPDFELRHLEFSLSPLGVESLCIPLGIVVRADLYVDSDIDAFDFPRCVDGVREPVPDEELCPANADHGCVAGVFLELGLSGIRATGFVAGFDLGPLHTDAMLLDLRLTLLEQRLELAGGITIDLPTDPGTVLARGYGRIFLSPTDVAVDAEVEVYELFQAYVHLAGSLDLTDPGFEIDVVFRGDSDFAETVSGLVEDGIDDFVATAETIADGMTALVGTEEDARDAIDRLGSDAPAADEPLWLSHRIKAFHAAMDDLGLALPPWLLIDLNSNGEFDLEELDIETPDLSGVVVDAINVGLGGLCFVADPDEDPVDGYGDDLGLPCNWAAFKTAVGNGLAAAIPGLGDPGAALGDAVGDFLAATGEVFSLECASFSAQLGTLGASVDLGVLFTALGEDYEFFAGWTFEPGFDSVDDFVDSILAFFFEDGNGSVTCDVPALAGPESGIFAVANPSIALEGATVTLDGSFAIPPAASRSVTIDWGDGSPDTTFNTAAPTFSRTHVYADDGSYVISVTSGDDDAMTGVTVTNVAPVIDDPLAGTSGVEGTAVSLPDASFSDGGSADTHTATINWGDGSAIEDAAVSGTSVTFPTHRYPDSGTYTILVCVFDDDGGTGCDTTTAIISNVAPVTTAGADTGGAEGSEIVVGASFTDAGTLDTHTATVDWGDGTTAEVATVAETTSGPPGSATPMSGSVTDSHVYADDGIYPVEICITDDDGEDALADCDTLHVTVTNVTPVTTAGPDKTTSEGSAVTVGATFLDAGTLDSHTATVDWDDGSAAEPALATESPFGPPGSTDGASGSVSASHVYADNGVYDVELCVTDDELASHCASVQVTVTNVAPTVDAGADQTVPEGDVLSLAPATFNDRGTLDTHTATVSWGDGTIADLGVVTESPSGPPGSTAGADGTVEASHVYADNGTYTVFVCVTDDDGGSRCDRLFVTVTNVAPAAAVTTVGEGPAFFLPHVDVPVTGTLHDQGTLDTHTATFDWGDGTSSDATVTETPFGPPGSTDGMDGMVEAVHGWTEPGLFDVVLSVTDDDGDSGTATVQVEVVTPEQAVARVIEWLTDLQEAETDPTVKAALLEAIKDLDGPANKPNAGAVDKLRDGDDPAALQKIAEALADLQVALDHDPTLELRDTFLVLTQVAESVSASLLVEAEAAIDPTSPGAVKQLTLLQELHDDATALSAMALAMWDLGDRLDAAAAFRDAVATFHQVAREADRLA